MRTLEVLAKEDPLNDWIYARISPFLEGRVLEIGCGIGTFTRHLVKDHDVVAVDPWEEAIRRATTAVGDRARFVVSELSDLQGKVESSFGGIVCLNVLEHIEDDVGALKTMQEMLLPGGHVTLLVPAWKWLFGSLDTSFGHYRRYRRLEVDSLFRQTGLAPVDVRYFNLLGVPGWIIGGKILRIRQLRSDLLRTYRLLLPPFRWLEDRVRIPLGLSVMAIGRKPLH